MDALHANLILNFLGTLGVIASFIFILIIKLHLRQREEFLNKKLEGILILTDKLIEHAEEIKDKSIKGIIFDHKEIKRADPRAPTPKNSSGS